MREVAPHFNNIEEALQFHSGRPSSAKKIPVIWGLLEEDPRATNRTLSEKLSEKGLFADGTLIGEIRRSVRRAKGMPARKNKTRNVKGRSKDKPRKDSASELPTCLRGELLYPVELLLSAMSRHGLTDICVDSKGVVSVNYAQTKVVGVTK